jgi:hypothetical protein
MNLTWMGGGGRLGLLFFHTIGKTVLDMEVIIKSSLSPTVLCTVSGVSYSSTVEALKERISKETKLPVSNFWLRNRDRKLKEDDIIGECYYGTSLTFTLVYSFQERMCSICLEAEYNRPNWGTPENKDPVFFGCGHQMHYQCYAQLLKTSKKCPECAKGIVFQEHDPETYKQLLKTSLS